MSRRKLDVIATVSTNTPSLIVVMRTTLLPGSWYSAKRYEDLPNDGVREAVTGWRLWRVDGWQLRSVSLNTAWLPGVPMTGNPHDPLGRAGVYAFRDPIEAERNLTEVEKHQRGYVAGSVTMWSDVVEHERGYRAERAKITSLVAASPDVDLDGLRVLYLGLTCPGGATPVIDRSGRLVGITSLKPKETPRWWNPYLMREIREDPAPVQVAQPFDLSLRSFLYPDAVTPSVEHFTYQTHFWNGRALILEEGQHPEWLPGWVPLPEKKVKQP